jgi:uncharacterized protein (DUF1697 family)
MTPYVAFLRAINVAGHAIVKMEALEASFAARRATASAATSRAAT